MYVKTFLNDSPKVFTIDNFLSQEECNYIKGKAETSLRPSVVSESKGGVRSPGRTSTTAWLDYKSDGTLKKIAERCSQLVDTNWKNFEQLQVVKYNVGDQYGWHYDAYKFDSERGKRCTAERGQRLKTLIFYLNEVEEGGETGFRDLKDSSGNRLKVSPELGKCLVFENVLPGTNELDMKSIHSGLPIKKGVKYMANFWLREYPFDKPRPRYIPPKETEENKSKNVLSVPTVSTPPAKSRGGETTYEENNNPSFYRNLLVSNTQYGDIHGDYVFLYSSIGALLGVLKNQRGRLFEKNLLEKEYTSLKDYDYDFIKEGVFTTPASQVIKNYFKTCIDKGYFRFGDRQSERYVSRNCKFSRILNFELEPLVSKIVGKPVKASYTYLAGYKNGSALHPHLDRPECSYTVSYLIDRDPPDMEWNIYVEKEVSNQRGGRIHYETPLEQCYGLDCNINGFMIFRGCKHNHFRLPYEGNYSTFLLLHYVDA